MIYVLIFECTLVTIIMSSNLNYDFILERINFSNTILLDEPGQTYTCGRGKENKIICLSLTVSRRHCSFFRSNHEIYVIDLGSSNGVFVNEVRQKARHMVKLNDNDIIGIGCPNANAKNRDMFIYKLRFVIKDQMGTKISLSENTLIEINKIHSSSKRKANNEPSPLIPSYKISKLSKDIPCQVEIVNKKLNMITNKDHLNQKITTTNTPIESDSIELNTSSSDALYNSKYQRVNIDTYTSVFKANSEKKMKKQDKFFNEKRENQSIRENEVIFIDPPRVIDTEILQQDYNSSKVEKSNVENILEKNNHDINVVYMNDIDESNTHVDINNVIKILPQQRQDSSGDIKMFDGAYKSLVKYEEPLTKKNELSELTESSNIIHTGDYFIKMEDELIIDDNDEEAIQTSMRNFSSYAISPIKLKQIKQEPKSRFSELDIVNLSDGEEDIFPCSQLFDSGLDVHSEVKEKVKQECNDNHDEYVNRLDDTEIIISLSDSEDEDNVWLHRLSQSQLLNNTFSNNNKTNHAIETVKEEPMDLDAIDNDLRNIIEESNKNTNNVSYKFNVDAEIKEGSNIQTGNKDEVKEKVKQKCNDNHDEYVNRLDDTEIVISLSDSEDKDNVWLLRLSQSQLLNNTFSNNNKTNHAIETVKEEPMDLDAIDNDLRNIIEESNKNANNVSYKFNVDAEIKEGSNIQTGNKDEEENIKEKRKNTAHFVISSEGMTCSQKVVKVNGPTNDPVNTEQEVIHETLSSLNEKRYTTDNNTMSGNIHNSTTHFKEIKSMIKKTQIIDPPYMPIKKTQKSMCQSKEIGEITHDKKFATAMLKKATHGKKNTSAEQKIEEYMYLKEQKKRRTIHTWANCLPPSKGKKTSLSKEEKKQLIESRKSKLKQIATEDKKATVIDNETLKRTITKPKAKISLKSRGDFLINETQPQTSTNRAIITKSKENKKLKNNSVNAIRENHNVTSLIPDLKIKVTMSAYKETLNNVTKDLQQSLTVNDINATQLNKINESDRNLNKCNNIIDKAFDIVESKNAQTAIASSLEDEIKAKNNLKMHKENCSPNKQATNKFEKKTKTVLFNDVSEIREYEIDPQNTLKKLKGKDAPIPIDKLSSKKSIGTNCPKLEDFLLHIFMWHPVWLEEQKHLQRMPPIIKENELHPMLTFYKSYNDYYKIVVPLLLLEIWYGITKEFEMIEKNAKRPTMICSILKHSIMHTHVPSANMYLSTLTVQVLITRENLCQQVHPNYGDLVFFEYIKNENGKHSFRKVFAYVTNMHQTIITPFIEYNKDLENYVKKPYALLTYTLMTKKLEENLALNRVQRIRTVTYLRSNMRMIQAIQYLPQSPLIDLILQPKVEAYQLSQIEIKDYQLMTKDKLNQKQLEAVIRVTDAVIQEGAKVCCIQGPPGTGKSKVIVNIITEILYGNNRYENNKAALRILVCAPSNAAIDEIVLRLLAIRATIKQKRFKMVRIGRPETMHQMVKDISLTELGKRDVKRVTESYSSKNIPIDSVEEEKLFLEARINALKCEILNSQKIDDTYKKHLKMKLADMTTKYELLKNHRSIDEMSNQELAKLQRLAERRILEGADIITCTLSSCYTNQMESIFGGNNKRISVCIVDEATQSCEAETLIPLLLGVNTLVLVGDPNQLPATIISQQAKRLGLDQSLFSRIQNAFQGEKNNPIIMLNTQYRMAYSISYWPNKYFYGCKLKNAAQNILTFPFHSYRVLNLNANQNNDKFSNTNEAEFIANIILCMLIKSNLKKWESNISIGVLTPYKNQRFLVSQKINEKITTVPDNIKKKFTVEVNTVDSFQGQERDIILMSCVRSHGIGFLSDRQRLCVALTRAKHTLILCGNFHTFMRDQMWNALILDAKSRGIYKSIDANANLNEIKPHIIK